MLRTISSIASAFEWNVLLICFVSAEMRGSKPRFEDCWIYALIKLVDLLR